MRTALAFALCLASSAALAGDPLFDQWRAKQRAWIERKQRDDLEREKARIQAQAEIAKARAIAEALRPPPVEVTVVSPPALIVPLHKRYRTLDSGHHGLRPYHHGPYHHSFHHWRSGYRWW